MRDSLTQIDLKSWKYLACFDIKSQCVLKKGHQFLFSIIPKLKKRVMPSGPFVPGSRCEDGFVSSVFL